MGAHPLALTWSISCRHTVASVMSAARLSSVLLMASQNSSCSDTSALVDSEQAEWSDCGGCWMMMVCGCAGAATGTGGAGGMGTTTVCGPWHDLQCEGDSDSLTLKSNRTVSPSVVVAPGNGRKSG